MIDLLKKSFLTGLGVASLTGEKIEEFAGELRQRGELSKQEGERFVEEARQKVEQSKDALRRQVESAVQMAIAQLSLPRQEDIRELKEEVERLRKELAVLKEKNEMVQDD